MAIINDIRMLAHVRGNNIYDEFNDVKREDTGRAILADVMMRLSYTDTDVLETLGDTTIKKILDDGIFLWGESQAKMIADIIWGLEKRVPAFALSSEDFKEQFIFSQTVNYDPHGVWAEGRRIADQIFDTPKDDKRDSSFFKSIKNFLTENFI